MSRREFIAVISGAVIAKTVEKVFDVLDKDKLELKATLSHDGYARYYSYIDPSTNTLLRVYPLLVKITNIGSIPFTIHSVVPYSIDPNNKNSRTDLLFKDNMEIYTKKSLKYADVEDVVAKAFIKESFFQNNNKPDDFSVALETEVIILGINKEYQKATIRSINMNLDGIEITKPENDIVDFKKHKLVELKKK